MGATPIFDTLCTRAAEAASEVDTPAPVETPEAPAPEGMPDVEDEAPTPVRLSVTVVWVATLAEQEALELGHRRLGTEHLLLALIRMGDPVGRRLAAHGAPLAAVRRAIVRADAPGALDTENGRPGWSTLASAAVGAARRRARAEGRSEVTTADLAAALLVPGGRAAAVLRSLGVDPAPEVALRVSVPAAASRPARSATDGHGGRSAAPGSSEPDTAEPLVPAAGSEPGPAAADPAAVPRVPAARVEPEERVRVDVA